MPKYWGNNHFAHRSFPEVGQKQKTEKKKEEKKQKQWPSYAWRTQAHMAHASHLGQKIKHYLLNPIVSIRQCAKV